jgi:hypothetical protein
MKYNTAKFPQAGKVINRRSFYTAFKDLSLAKCEGLRCTWLRGILI